ncbi:hypothetical protein BD560DRAFT_491246 [Blakeslea trispora]|nr:hypothetical protein BD560DRAFT_491246 [Blakeslea trispora]
MSRFILSYQLQKLVENNDNKKVYFIIICMLMSSQLKKKRTKENYVDKDNPTTPRRESNPFQRNLDISLMKTKYNAQRHLRTCNSRLSSEEIGELFICTTVEGHYCSNVQRSSWKRRQLIRER